MTRFGRSMAALTLLMGGGLLAACSNSAGGLVTGSNQTDGEVPGGITNASPLARPIGVAWTSARAQRCGFYFDATKLRASYLAYEAKQGNAEQLSKAEKSYDATFKTIRERVSADPDYCTDAKGNAIKADLQRHLAGDFSPKFPEPKKVEACPFLGCPTVPTSDEPFNSKKMFDDIDRRQNK